MAGFVSTVGSARLDDMSHKDLSHLGHDQKLVSKIMRKREEEMQRRIRLLNPKNRLGIPHETLNEQIAAKNESAGQESAEEAYYARSLLFQEQVAQACEEAKDRIKREREKETRDYSLEHLRKEDRREYHLSDPSQLKKEQPLALGEWDHPDLGISSMQIFKGNRKNNAEFVKKEKEDYARWQKDAMAYKESVRQREKEADRLYDEQVLYANSVRGLCERAKAEERHQETLATASDNQFLAEARREKQARLRAREIEEKNKHVSNVRNSDRLTEATPYQVGPSGQLVRDAYRRLSPEEIQDNYNIMAHQVLEKQEQRRQECEDEERHAELVHRGVAVMGALEEEKQRIKKERQMEMVRHNQALAQAKRDGRAGERAAYLSFEPQLGS